MQTLSKWLKVSTKVFIPLSVTEYILRNVKKRDKIGRLAKMVSIIKRIIDIN